MVSWGVVFLCALLGACGATLVMLFGWPGTRRAADCALAGAGVGGVLAVCWSFVLTDAAPWQLERYAQPPPWSDDTIPWLLFAAATLGAVASVLAWPARAKQPRITRILITLVVTLMTAVSGSVALGHATAWLSGSPRGPSLWIWTTPEVTNLDLRVTVGDFDWNADPAFVTGGATVSIDVKGRPGTAQQVVILGSGYFATSDVDGSPTTEVDPEVFRNTSRQSTPCAVAAGANDWSFDGHSRVLLIDVTIGGNGTGGATVNFTDRHQWWHASGDRTEVQLPALRLASDFQCLSAPGIGAQGWSGPSSWSIVETTGQPNLDPGDEVIVPRVAGEEDELYAPHRAARWTSTSATHDSSFLAPMYRLVTANTRARASTYAFVAALLWGLMLTGVFDLVRSGPWPTGPSSTPAPEVAASSAGRRAVAPPDLPVQGARRRSPRASRSTTRVRWRARPSRLQ